jgi:hypothetical protein
MREWANPKARSELPALASGRHFSAWDLLANPRRNTATDGDGVRCKKARGYCHRLPQRRQGQEAPSLWQAEAGRHADARCRAEWQPVRFPSAPRRPGRPHRPLARRRAGQEQPGQGCRCLRRRQPRGQPGGVGRRQGDGIRGVPLRARPPRSGPSPEPPGGPFAAMPSRACPIVRREPGARAARYTAAAFFAGSAGAVG